MDHHLPDLVKEGMHVYFTFFVGGDWDKAQAKVLSGDPRDPNSEISRYLLKEAKEQLFQRGQEQQGATKQKSATKRKSEGGAELFDVGGGAAYDPFAPPQIDFGPPTSQAPAGEMSISSSDRISRMDQEFSNESNSFGKDGGHIPFHPGGKGLLYPQDHEHTKGGKHHGGGKGKGGKYNHGKEPYGKGGKEYHHGKGKPDNQMNVQSEFGPAGPPDRSQEDDSTSPYENQNELQPVRNLPIDSESKALVANSYKKMIATLQENGIKMCTGNCDVDVQTTYRGWISKIAMEGGDTKEDEIGKVVFGFFRFRRFFFLL